MKKGRPLITAALLVCHRIGNLPFDNFLPLVVDLLAQLRGRFGNRRKIFHPLERTASVDHRAGVETLLARMDARIEGAAPFCGQKV